VHKTRRLFILGVLVAIAISYVGPIRGYRSHHAELREQQVTLGKLIKERDELRATVSAPQTPEAIEQRARELGFIKRGELLYRVRNLEPDPSAGRGRRGIGSWFPPVA
jgi:cell division protein FtsB